MDHFSPFVVANAAFDDPDALREMMRQDGYLYFRGVAPQERLLDVRRDVLEVCRAAGWVRPSGDPYDATWSGLGPYAEGDPEYLSVYARVVRLPSFNELPEDARLVHLIGHLLDGPVMCHRQHVGRIRFPQDRAATTGPHQDWQSVRGTPETFTCWMPLGDCPLEMGGLAILRGSHRAGFIEHGDGRAGPGRGPAPDALADHRLPGGPEVEWHAGDFRCGDLLLFHSFTVHQALPNLTGDRLRLSVDNRYQRHGEPVAAASMRGHYDL